MEVITRYQFMGKIYYCDLSLNLFKLVFRCGTFMIHDPSCNKWERDYSKPYPECCNAFICVEPSKQEVSISEVENNSLD